MKETDLLGRETPRGAVRVEMLMAVLYEGRRLEPGEVYRLPGWFARQLLRQKRAQIAEVGPQPIARVAELELESAGPGLDAESAVTIAAVTEPDPEEAPEPHVDATDAAIALAADRIDLSEVEGTGAGGRITKADVERALAQRDAEEG